MLKAKPNDNSWPVVVMKPLLFILVFVIALGVFMVNVWDPDFWWHLATGRWIVEHGRLPVEDTFSFATLQQDPFSDINWVKFILSQYWLAQVLFYKLYSLYGFAGISVFRALILTGTIGLMVLTLRHHKVQAVLILPIALLSIFMLKDSTGERPQLFSFFFAALLLYLLEVVKTASTGRQGRADEAVAGVQDAGNGETAAILRPVRGMGYWLIAVPFLMALWSNLHGGYVYGIFILLIYILSGWLNILIARFRAMRGPHVPELKLHTLLTVTGVIAIFAAGLNPNGYQGIINMASVMSHQVSSVQEINAIDIQEMMPTYKFFKREVTYFAMVLVVGALILAHMRKGGKADITHVLLFLAIVFLSMSALRFVPFFVICGSSLLGIYLQPFLPRGAFGGKKWLEGVALLAPSLLIVVSAVSFGEEVSPKSFYGTGVSYGKYPYNAANFMKVLPPGKIFNPYTWGGYLIWALYPDPKVFVDGRGLNREILIQYAEIMTMSDAQRYSGMPKWKAILDSYRINYLLLAPLMEFASNWGLINAVSEDSDWRLIYADNTSLIYVRNKEEFRDIIERYGLPSDVAYATIAWQALGKAKDEKDRKQKAEYYLIASGSFVRMNKFKNARLSVNKALEADPANREAQWYANLLGKE